MALEITRIGGDGLQVENDEGHWLIVTLDELRSHAAPLRADMIGDASAPAEADLFVWAAFAVARAMRWNTD